MAILVITQGYLPSDNDDAAKISMKYKIKMLA